MNENIRVAVRVKPLLSNETPASSVSLNVNPSQKTIEYVNGLLRDMFYKERRATAGNSVSIW